MSEYAALLHRISAEGKGFIVEKEQVKSYVSETVLGSGDTMTNKTDTDVLFINKVSMVFSFVDMGGARGQTKDIHKPRRGE